MGQLLYKLTNEHGRTMGNTQWGESVTHSAKGSALQDLCSDGWIHAYEHPLLAVFLNPIHAGFHNPQLWEADGVIGKRDGQLKVGCRSLTTVRKRQLPVVTIEERVRFAILVAKAVYSEKTFTKWADEWLLGKNRSEAAARAAEAAARAAAWAAVWAARPAAEAAARAAEAAARAAARAAAWAAAEAAARAAAWAAEAAAEAAAWEAAPINLIAIAEQALLPK